MDEHSDGVHVINRRREVVQWLRYGHYSKMYDMIEWHPSNSGTLLYTLYKPYKALILATHSLTQSLTLDAQIRPFWWGVT